MVTIAPAGGANYNSHNPRYIYLAGKIKLGHGATGYRTRIAPLLQKHGILSLDPLRGKYEMASWDSLADNEVVVRDLQDIERAHVVLAVMMKCEDTSFGTPCEIMYAWERRIPIIMITNERYLANHFWVRSLCSSIFFVDEENGETFDDVLIRAAEHIGYWFGTILENEVYNNPQLTQERPTNTATTPDNTDVVRYCCRCGKSIPPNEAVRVCNASLCTPSLYICRSCTTDITMNTPPGACP